MTSIIRGDDNFDSDIIPSGRVASAWVNFDGTGTVAIRDQFNVASTTDLATGEYAVNFNNSLSNANYSVGTSCQTVASGAVATALRDSPDPSTTSVSVRCTTASGGAGDSPFVFAIVFGGV